jgi:hypothetical protein
MPFFQKNMSLQIQSNACVMTMSNECFIEGNEKLVLYQMFFVLIFMNAFTFALAALSLWRLTKVERNQHVQDMLS